MSAGPQIYPGASKAYWFQGAYPGDAQEVNVVVLHTTEGRSVPTYGGGASAPNLTALPDIPRRRLSWYQHFDFDRSARALVNKPGGVNTNTLNVSQAELVGTCDPATRQAWVKAGHRQDVDFIYWPEAPDWALAGVAAFLAWAHAQHGVPLTGPKSWKAYPASAGANGVRMTFAVWEDFRGICGHMHVPENTHGDPGAIDFDRILAFAKGTAQEQDMTLTDADVKKFWTTDGIIANPNADTAKENPYIAPATGLRNIEILTRRVDKTLAGLVASNAALSATVGALAKGGGLTAAEIQEAAEAGARAALDQLGAKLQED
ncbi:hypothetical protein ACIQPQ_34270 [Streptomyces sp. NPDC091281]|uniref:hypothetical protein n=1 Tax=Streptomyces sp. NPDC091281 TaxID=3365985 RepID=UPI0038038DA0